MPIEQRDRGGRTALHRAVLGGDTDRVRTLIGAGAAIDSPGPKGFTPLHLAAQQSALEPARLLLEAGAAVDARNAFGNSPLLVAVMSFRGGGELIELLLQHGADPGLRNSWGDSPLSTARRIADADVARFFPGEAPRADQAESRPPDSAR